MSQGKLNPLRGWMRAPKHAPRGPFRLLECRHGLADIVERKEWAADGRRTVRDDWTDAYALELAERVQDAVDSLDVNERAVNAVLAYLRIGKAAVGDGLPGRDMVKFSAKTRGCAHRAARPPTPTS